MNAAFLFDYPEYVEPIKWNEKAVSASHNERQIIRWIMLLHNQGQPIEADVTYSSGRFWTGLPGPRFKFDLMPQSSDVIPADARHLPLCNNCLQSLMFDPPFVVAPSPKPGIIRDRFSCYPNVSALWSFYGESIKEFARILKPDGILIFKCQDIISGGKQHFSHVEIVNLAHASGFDALDLFVLVRYNVVWSPNMEHQQHARKNHSYYLVFKK